MQTVYACAATQVAHSTAIFETHSVAGKILGNKTATTVALLELFAVMLTECFLPKIGQIMFGYWSKAYLTAWIEGFGGTGFVVRMPRVFDEFRPYYRLFTCGADKVMWVPLLIYRSEVTALDGLVAAGASGCILVEVAMLMIGASLMRDEGCSLQILIADFADKMIGVPDFAHGLNISALDPFTAAAALEHLFGNFVLLLSGTCRCHR